MPNNQDITPPSRSIRDIPVGGAVRRPPTTPPAVSGVRPAGTVPVQGGGIPHVDVPHRKHRPWGWALIIIVACVVAGLLLSTIFEHASITVTLKTARVSSVSDLTAVPNGPLGSLSYQTLTASQTATTSVSTNGTQHVSRPATGVVTIYNAYSTSPQALVANTRLVTSGGSIYRIKDAVTVPGGTKKADGTLNPGSVTVSVYADKPGPTSNTTGAIQLSILGFKGDPKYNKFVVQSQGAISGGFTGDEPAAAPADLAAAQAQLKRQLDDAIRSAATTQVPSGFVAVNGTLGVTYTNISQTPGPAGTMVLSEGATATLAMVRIDDVAAALAKEAVSDYAGEAVTFTADSTPTLSLAPGQSSSTITGPLHLTLSGTSTVVWRLDQNALQQALLGKSVNDFQASVSAFKPAVVKAEASVRPFWKNTFSTDSKKLTITVAQ